MERGLISLTARGSTMLLLVFMLGACDRALDPSAGALAAARGFYTWYQSPADSSGGGASFRRAIELRPEAFSASLRSALEEDLAAAKADSEYIVGLDFDPLTNSQDPCESYQPGSAEVRGDIVRVAVVERCSTTSSRGTPLTLELRSEAGAWRISDVEFADGGRLSIVLARLKDERRGSAEPSIAERPQQKPTLD